MANLTQTRTAVDTFLASKLSLLESHQQTFLLTNGRHWQGLPTHAAPPAHTNASNGSVPPDRFAAAPTDLLAFPWSSQFSAWAGEFFPASVHLDVYEGPLGRGWVVTVEMEHAGVRWQRAVNIGPETWREQAWRIAPLQPSA